MGNCKVFSYNCSINQSWPLIFFALRYGPARRGVPNTASLPACSNTAALRQELASTMTRSKIGGSLAGDGELESAQELALSWLTLTDNRQFESSWNDASTFFQAAISESGWVSSLSPARSSLGGLTTRRITASTFSKTLRGAPYGRYIVFEFDTSFEKRVSATETLAMIKVGNDMWRVAAYSIR